MPVGTENTGPVAAKFFSVAPMKMVIEAKEATMIGRGDSYQHMQDDGAGMCGWSLELEDEKATNGARRDA